LSDVFRCAAASQSRSEPMYATASHVHDWLLIEQPGGWGHDAATQSRLDPDLGRSLVAKARAERIRLILIKRGTRLAGPRPEAYVCHVATDTSFLERISIEGPEDLLERDFSALRDGRGGYGKTVDEPIYLTCTHGRHDACCSIRGNAVSRALIGAMPGRAWEASHIGGDRFAANVVCLPHGIYYGRVAAADAGLLARALDQGRLDLHYYRGRCCYPFPLQAAEYFVRRERGLTGLGDVTLLEVVHVEDDTLSASFEAGGRQITVRIGINAGSDGYLLTCKSAVKHRPPRFELLSLTFSSPDVHEGP
jgi:hypothetical protein